MRVGWPQRVGPTATLVRLSGEELPVLFPALAGFPGDDGGDVRELQEGISRVRRFSVGTWEDRLCGKKVLQRLQSRSQNRAGAEVVWHGFHWRTSETINRSPSSSRFLPDRCDFAPTIPFRSSVSMVRPAQSRRRLQRPKRPLRAAGHYRSGPRADHRPRSDGGGEAKGHGTRDADAPRGRPAEHLPRPYHH